MYSVEAGRTVLRDTLVAIADNSCLNGEPDEEEDFPISACGVLSIY